MSLIWTRFSSTTFIDASLSSSCGHSAQASSRNIKQPTFTRFPAYPSPVTPFSRIQLRFSKGPITCLAHAGLLSRLFPRTETPVYCMLDSHTSASNEAEDRAAWLLSRSSDFHLKGSNSSVVTLQVGIPGLDSQLESDTVSLYHAVGLGWPPTSKRAARGATWGLDMLTRTSLCLDRDGITLSSNGMSRICRE